MCGGFLKRGAETKYKFSPGLDLNLRHPCFNADRARVGIGGKNFLQWRFAFEHCDRLRTQLRFRAQNRCYWKVRHEDAGKRHRTVVGRQASVVSKTSSPLAVLSGYSLVADCYSLLCRPSGFSVKGAYRLRRLSFATGLEDFCLNFNS